MAEWLLKFPGDPAPMTVKAESLGLPKCGALMLFGRVRDGSDDVVLNQVFAAGTWEAITRVGALHA